MLARLESKQIKRLLSLDLTQLNIYVWGMGAKGRDFWNKYSYFEELYEKLPYLCPNIVAVVDSACRGKMMQFFGRKVIHPSEIDYRGNRDLFIVAVERSFSIRSCIMSKGYSTSNIIFYEDFLEVLRFNIISKRRTILSHFLTNEGLYHDILNENLSWDKRLDCIKFACEELDSTSHHVKNLLHALLISIVYENFEDVDSVCGANLLQIAEDKLDKADFIAGAEMYFGMDIRKLSDYFAKKSKKALNEKVKIIGLYDTRYRNGGGQKVVSLLIPIYIKRGYRVVLFTEEYCPEEEYTLPDGVVRVVLPMEAGKDRQGRWQFLLEQVRLHGVQVMCFHNSEYSRQFFFDMLWLHMNNVPVITEIHLNFMGLFERYSGITAFLPYIYKLADCLVVLSRCDETFWRHLGCRAKYIPNPLEKVEYTCKYKKTNGKRIIWIGRLEDGGKKFSDAIDIMEMVVREVPSAILDVIGKAENEAIEEKLKQYIVSKGLGNCVVMHGYQTDVAKFYKEADVMLFTSRREGFPLVIAESKQYGLPLVLYELPYLELLQDKRGVISVRQGDKKSAANALIHLLNDEKLRERMGEDARASLTWLCDYDIGGAWDDIFSELGNLDKSVNSCDDAFSMVEKLMLEGLEESKQAIW